MSRLKTLFWFLLTLFFIWRLLFPGEVNDSSITRPTSEDTRSSGLAGLTRWIERSGIEVHSQRLRFGDLPPRVADSSGHLAIVHLPSLLVYEAEEIKALLHWVELGNTLLISAGYLEGSDWIYDGNRVDIHRSFWRLTGLDADFVPAVSDEDPDGESAAAAGTDTSGDADSDSEGLSEAIESVADDLSESMTDALELPGWLQVHGASEAVVVEPAGMHPLVDGLNDLQAPWDEMGWEVVLPVEQALRLELSDARDAALREEEEAEAEAEAESQGNELDENRTLLNLTQPPASQVQDTAQAGAVTSMLAVTLPMLRLGNWQAEKGALIFQRLAAKTGRRCCATKTASRWCF